MKGLQVWVLACLLLVLSGCSTPSVRPELLRAESILALDRLGEEYYLNQQIDSAKDVFSELLKVSPEHENAHFRLGNIAFLKRDLDTAETHFNKVVEQTPDNMRAQYNLAVIHLVRAESAFQRFKQVATPDFDSRAVDRLLQTIKDFSAGRLAADANSGDRRELLKKLVEMADEKSP